MKRSRKTSQRAGRRPEPPKGAELILKRNCEFQALEVRSGVFLLGNKAGWLWLADYCHWIASRIDERAPFVPGDPDDHVHCDMIRTFNKDLSDVFGFIVGSYSDRNRRRVLKALRCTRARSLGGHPSRQFGMDLKYLTEAIEMMDGRVRAQTLRELRLLLPQLKSAIGRFEKELKGGRIGDREQGV